MHKLKKQAFTLVELIVVITILAILATIAFVSFQSYTKNSRDWDRLTTMRNIVFGLTVYQTKNLKYPIPEDYTEITASWSPILYQWLVWKNTSNLLWFNKDLKDPYDQLKYIYSTNTKLDKYQILWYLETTDSLSFLSKTYANYTDRYPKIFWDELWIILDWNNNTITWATFDIKSTNTSHKIYFSDTDVITSSSWSVLFSNIYNRNLDLLRDTTFANLDDNLVLYYDMWTMTWGKLKDLSKNSNDWTFSWNITTTSWNNGKGLAQYFAWNWYIKVPWSNSLQITKEITVCSLVKYDTWVPRNWWVGWQSNGWILAKRNTWLTTWHYWFWKFNENNSSWNANKLSFCANNWAWQCTLSDFKLTLGEYYNVCSTYDWNNVVLYLDWNKLYSYTKTWTIITDNWNLYIWWYEWNWTPWSEEYLHGTIDEVRLYNKALSESEIKALYNSTK